jgi:hypothetical protein
MRSLNRRRARLAMIGRLTGRRGSRVETPLSGPVFRPGAASWGAKTRKNGEKSPKNPKKLEKTREKRRIGAVSATGFR